MKESETDAWPALGDTGHPHDGSVPTDGRDSWEFDPVEFFANDSSVLPSAETKRSKPPTKQTTEL